MIDFLKGVLEWIRKVLIIVGLVLLFAGPTTLLAAFAMRESSWIWGTLAILCFLLTMGIAYALVEGDVL